MSNFLRNTLLSLSQWLLLTLAGFLGAMIVAFKLQQGKLHHTQVELLRKSVELDTSKDDGLVSKAREAFQRALEEYDK